MLRIKASHVPEKITDLISPRFLDEHPKLRSLVAQATGQALLDSAFSIAAAEMDVEERIARAIKQLLITQKEIDDDYRPSFEKIYEKTGGGDPKVYFHDLKISWPVLRRIINSSVEPSSAAFRFIHRFGTTVSMTPSWFLTAERLVLETTGSDSAFREDGYWFDINDSGTPSYEGTALPSGIALKDGDWHGEDYYNAVSGKAGSEAGDKKDWVKSLILPARELQALVEHNTTKDCRESYFSIGFKSVSYEAAITALYPDAKVKWPHCVLVYALYNNTPLIENNNVVSAAPFRDRAANYDTLCPPGCKVYHWPPDLTL